MTSAVLRSTSQDFCKMFVRWSLSDVLLMIGTRVWGGGPQGWKPLSSRPVKGACCQRDPDRWCWLSPPGQVSSGFFTVTSSPHPHPFHTVLLKEVTMRSPCLRSGHHTLEGFKHRKCFDLNCSSEDGHNLLIVGRLNFFFKDLNIKDSNNWTNELEKSRSYKTMEGLNWRVGLCVGCWLAWHP